MLLTLKNGTRTKRFWLNSFNEIAASAEYNTMLLCCSLLQSIHIKQSDKDSRVNCCTQGHLTHVLFLFVDNVTDEHGCQCHSRWITITNGARGLLQNKKQNRNSSLLMAAGCTIHLTWIIGSDMIPDSSQNKWHTVFMTSYIMFNRLSTPVSQC